MNSNRLHNLAKPIFKIEYLMWFAILVSSSATALERTDSLDSFNSESVVIVESGSVGSAYHKPQTHPPANNVIRHLNKRPNAFRQYSQNDGRRLKGEKRGEVRGERKGERIHKSDIMREVKNRYDAEVLRISLNNQGTAYRVRILLPNGRVKAVVIDAYR